MNICLLSYFLLGNNYGVTPKRVFDKSTYFILFIVVCSIAVIIGFLIMKVYKNKALVIAEKLEKEEIQKELLNQKVNTKEEEIKRLVADNSMRLKFKEELLQKLKDKVANNGDLKGLRQSLESLIFELQSQITTEAKLSPLQSSIEEVNQGFEAKLRELYPKLTKTEREICTLLRLNLSIKEIMTIRSASVDAIKSARYRIRKKMGLSPREELEQFIQSL